MANGSDASSLSASPPRRACGQPPERGALREAALAHLARFGTTQHGLEQVLSRMVGRWARRATAQGMAAEMVEEATRSRQVLISEIVAELGRIGAVDDAAFSRSRARSLTRSGRSRRAVHAHLAQRGVDETTREAALADMLGERHESNAHESELAAALVLARKRKLGPFSATDSSSGDHEVRHKALMILARAGFARDIADEALDLDPEAAMDHIVRLKST